MKYYIYARSMTGRNKPDLQIDCDSVSRSDGAVIFGRAGVGTVAAMAPGTWGVISTEDGLKMFESEPEPMFPDPGKETP